jgi:hypothetical protein
MSEMCTGSQERGRRRASSRPASAAASVAAAMTPSHQRAGRRRTSPAADTHRTPTRTTYPVPARGCQPGRFGAAMASGPAISARLPLATWIKRTVVHTGSLPT